MYMYKVLSWAVWMDKTERVWAERDLWWEKHYPVK